MSINFTCWSRGCEDSGSDAMRPQQCEDTQHTGFPPSISSWSPGSLHQSLFQLIKPGTATKRKQVLLSSWRACDMQTTSWMTGTSLRWFSGREILCDCWNSSIMFFTVAPSLSSRSQNTLSMLYGSYEPHQWLNQTNSFTFSRKGP